MTQPGTMQIFSDYVCTWGYLSAELIKKHKTKPGGNVDGVPFPRHPDTPAEGRSLADLFAGRNVDRKAMHAQMKARMDAEGLPYGERTMTYNTRLSQELGKWADTQPGGGGA